MKVSYQGEADKQYCGRSAICVKHLKPSDLNGKKKGNFSTKHSANTNSRFIANITVKTGLELCHIIKQPEFFI